MRHAFHDQLIIASHQDDSNDERFMFGTIIINGSYLLLAYRLSLDLREPLYTTSFLSCITSYNVSTCNSPCTGWSPSTVLGGCLVQSRGVLWRYDQWLWGAILWSQLHSFERDEVCRSKQDFLWRNRWGQTGWREHPCSGTNNISYCITDRTLPHCIPASYRS